MIHQTFPSDGTSYYVCLARRVKAEFAALHRAYDEYIVALKDAARGVLRSVDFVRTKFGDVINF